MFKRWFGSKKSPNESKKKTRVATITLESNDLIKQISAKKRELPTAFAQSVIECEILVARPDATAE